MEIVIDDSGEISRFIFSLRITLTHLCFGDLYDIETLCSTSKLSHKKLTKYEYRSAFYNGNHSKSSHIVII